MNKYQEALDWLLEGDNSQYKSGTEWDLLQELVDKSESHIVLEALYKDMLKAVNDGYHRGLHLDKESFDGGRFEAYRYILDYITSLGDIYRKKERLNDTR